VGFEVRPEALTRRALDEYAAVSIAFVVDRILQVTLADGGLGGMVLTETAVAQPYVKDYDAIEEAGPPTRWPERFDISGWGLICARRDGALAGGAVIAPKTPGLNLADGRDDVGVLWDIRVRPGERGAGVGSALLRAAAEWAQGRGCAWLKIETQNVNVAACRFYRKMGCTLGAVDRFAYPELPGEVRLLWWKPVAPHRESRTTESAN